MGCRTNCKIFEEFSTAIEWIAHTKPDKAHAYVVHIWDVFFFLSRILSSQPKANSESFKCLCSYMDSISSRQNSTASTDF